MFWVSLVVACAMAYQEKGRVSKWATAIIVASLLSLLIRMIWLKNRLVIGEEESEFALIDEKRKGMLIQWVSDLPENSLLYLIFGSVMLVCFGNELYYLGYACLTVMLVAIVILVGRRNLEREAEAAERDGDEGQLHEGDD